MRIGMGGASAMLAAVLSPKSTSAFRGRCLRAGARGCNGEKLVSGGAAGLCAAAGVGARRTGARVVAKGLLSVLPPASGLSSSR